MRVRLRRILRYWPALTVLAILLVGYMAWPGRVTYTVTPETTHITDPLDAQGYPDYPTALNDRLARDVTPENNANVLIVRALGPRPEGAPLLPEFYRRLGIDPLPDDGDYLLGQDAYLNQPINNPPEAVFGCLGEPGRVVIRPPRLDDIDEPDSPVDLRKQWDDRVSRAGKWPWKRADLPD